MTLNEADKVVHPVETQWHYNDMIAAGFEPTTKEAVGLVRSYAYRREDHKIVVTTGYSADHWKDISTGATGYWSSLKPHLQSLV